MRNIKALVFQKTLALLLVVCMTLTLFPAITVYAVDSSFFGSASMTPPNVPSGTITYVEIRASINNTMAGAKHLFIGIKERGDGAPDAPIHEDYFFLPADSAGLYAEISIPALNVGSYSIVITERATIEPDSQQIGSVVGLLDFNVYDGDIAQLYQLWIEGLGFSRLSADINHDDGTAVFTLPYYTDDYSELTEVSVECLTEYRGTVTVGGTIYEHGDTVICDFSQGPVVFTVTSANGQSTKDYVVSLISPPADDVELVDIYTLDGGMCQGVIDHGAGEVYILTSRHVNLEQTEIKYYLPISAKAYIDNELINPTPDIYYVYEGDFTSPVIMRIESADGQTSKDYTITIENCNAWWEGVSAGPFTFNGLYYDGDLIESDQVVDATGAHALDAYLAYGQNAGRTGGYLHLISEDGISYPNASEFIETQNENLRHEAIDISNIKAGYYDVIFEYDGTPALLGGITVENNGLYRLPTPEANIRGNSLSTLVVEWPENVPLGGLSLEVVPLGGSQGSPETHNIAIEDDGANSQDIELSDYLDESGENQIRVKLVGDGSITSDSYFTSWISTSNSASETHRAITLDLRGIITDKDGTQINADGDGIYSCPSEGWIWYSQAHDEYAANTLVLDGLDINIEDDNPTSYRPGIYLPASSYVVLAGTDNSLVMSSESEDQSFLGICCDGDLTISGDGGIEIEMNAPFGAAIACINMGKLNISDGTFTIDSKTNGLNATGGVYISGGDFDIQCSGVGIAAEYNYVDISDGKINITSKYHGIVSMEHLAISGGEISVSISDDSDTSRGIIGARSISISDGSLIIEMAGDSAYGIYSSNAGESLDISGGTIEITASGQGSSCMDKEPTISGSAQLISGSWDGQSVKYNTAPATLYTVSVTNGTGGGSFTEGSPVTITANAASSGQQFKAWTANGLPGSVDLTTNPITFNMPAGNVTLTATYENIPAAVTGVTVNPPTVTVQKGTTFQFGATVAGTNNPSQEVTWGVTGNSSGGTSIDGSGCLTVAVGETATTLTVTATSVDDNSKSGSASVNVSDVPPPVPTVTSVTVNPSAIALNQGDNQTFGFIVNGTNSPSQSVTWSVEGGGTGTTITAGGLLIVSANETASTIMIRATSTIDTSKSGTAIVTVTQTTPMVYSVAVNGSYAATTGAGSSYEMGNTVTIYAGSRNNYTFSGWSTASSGVNFANANDATTTFPMPANNVTVTANWSYNGSGSDDNGGGGGGGGSSTDSSIYTTTITSDTDMPVTATVTIPGTVDTNGNITATITETMVRDAITKAQAEATKQGKTGDGIIVEIKITATGGKSLTAKVDQAALSRLSTAGAGLSFTSDIFRFTLDTAAVKSVNSQASGGVSFNSVPTDRLSSAAQAAIGNRPVYDFTLTDNTGKTITSYGSGSITRGINYTPASSERSGYLFAVKVLDNGNIQWITESSYSNGWLLWTGSSNSVYGVAYKTPALTFTDTTSHWAKDNIDFVTARGLFSGTSNTTFSPDTSITRGMFVTALGRLSGQDVSSYTTSSFTDVAAGSYYLPYIEWATAHKIVSGIGNNQFAPDKAITREEMAVMIYNYAAATKYTLPASREAVTFTDSTQISAWATTAVKALQQAGIVSGIGGGKFNPKGTATRAEAATILRNFVEGVIDESTARGWAKNEAGQWMYWTWDGQLRTGWINTTAGSRYYMDENGIMVAGKWVQIGGKWYYFYANGKLAVSTTIGGYEVGEDGARKE